MDDSTIWRWVLNIGAVLGGGVWLGRVHQKTSDNQHDIDKVLARLDAHTRDARMASDRVHAQSERLAVLETTVAAQTQVISAQSTMLSAQGAILTEIRDLVKK